MKVIKPLKLAVLHRTYENDSVYRFVPTFFICFPFDAADVALQEVHMWKVAAEALGAQGALDECMPKVHSEVLVSGKAYPPGGEPQPACRVGLRFERDDRRLIDKELYVVGDRHWDRGKATEPIPFREMPVDWVHAFGGEGFADNPIGKGAARVVDETTGEAVRPLPNVENPRHPSSAEGELLTPVGFGVVPLYFGSRMKKGGTYDARWQKERYPGFPEDIDWTFFNNAPRDQWLDGSLEGGEQFTIENMHPEEPKISSHVPCYHVRCFVTRERGQGETEFREVGMKLDTVHLFPNQKCGVVVFRGSTEVSEDDAADILQLVAACERPGQPRSVDHYRRVLEQRLDKSRAHLLALKDSDLFPPRPDGIPLQPGETLGQAEEATKLEQLALQNAYRRLASERAAALEAARQELLDQGIDPNEHLPREPEPLPPIEPPPDAEHLAEYVDEKTKAAEEAQAEAERQKVEALEAARQQCEEEGIDFDAAMADGERQGGGPPKFNAEEAFQKILDRVQLGRNAGAPFDDAEAQVRDPKTMEMLLQAEAKFKASYRKHAHYFPAAATLGPDEAQALRARVEAAVAAGESLKERDLTGADLSGLNLSGVDLSRSFLEKANLSGANLSHADLSEAVLARADLTDAQLIHAKLTGTNFGGANLLRTNLSGGVDLSGALFNGAQLTETNLSSARLDEASFLDAQFDHCDLREIESENLFFIRTENPEEELGLDFRNSNLAGAKLKSCVFIYANLSGCDVSNASFRECVFVGSKLDGVNFDQADCTQLRVVHGSTMEQATFRGAILDKSNLRSTRLKGCDFTGAKLKGSDLSESDLEGAKLTRIDAPGLLMMKANLCGADLSASNLMGAILQKSNIEGANFAGANLFRVDFALIRGNRDTNFDGANTKYLRFIDRKEGRHE